MLLAVDPNEWVEWIATLEAKLGKQWEMSKNRKNLAPGLADEREDEGFKEFAGHVLVDECCTNFDDRVWIKENSWGEVGKELVRRFEVAIQGPQQQKQQQQQQQKKKNQNIVNNNYKDGPVVNVLSTPDSIVAGHPPPSQSIPDSMDIDYATNTTTNEGRYSKNIYTESTVPMKGSVSCRSTVTPAANKNTTTTTTTTNNSSGSNRFGWNRKATIGTTAKNLHPSVSSHDLRAVAAVGIASSSSAMSSNTSIIPPVPTVVRRHPTSSSSSSSSSSSLTSTSKYNANLNPTSPLASINTTTAQGIITPSYKSTTSPIGGHDNNALHYHYHHHHHHPYAGQNPGKFSVSSSSIPIPSIKSMKYYNNNDVDGPVIIVKERQSIDSATTGDDNSNQNPWYQPIHTNTIEGSSAYMGLSSSSSTSLCTENLGTGGNTVVAGNPRALESSKSLVNQPPHPPSSSSSSLYHYNSTTKGDGVSYGNSVGGNRAQGFAYGYSHGHGKEGSSTAVHLPLYHYHHSNHSQPELSSTSSSNNTKYHKIPTTTTATTTPGGGGGGGNNSYSILSLSKLKKNSTIAISNAAAVSASNHRRRIIKGLTFNSSSNNNTNTNTNSNRGSNKYVN
ncbi:hypothetical protein H4219_004899 [Mycoemilia scoparia]|uniref:Uncharacterized protein n=1 Tax=Mycoemilia scoparia TaxID=417184 RepID=A0A9W8DQD0_9FUNG|nr:hypothetical protein H4219_004899 [Mycoemilia scoparia]